MPEITSNSTDGYDSSGLIATWDATHDSTGHPLANPDTNDTRTIDAVTVQYVAHRSKYWIRRAFYDFDTSGISATVSEATLKLYASTNTDCDIIVLKSLRACLYSPNFVFARARE